MNPLTISLAALLVLLGAQPISNASEITVVFRPIDNPVVWGLACHEDFRAVEVNHQDLCEGAPDNTAIIDVNKLRAYASQYKNYDGVFRYRLLEVLAHEACHFEPEHQSFHLTDGWEAFHEADCYDEGARYAINDQKRQYNVH